MMPTAEQRATFKAQLTAMVPHLRAFARSLCGRPDVADDLVQETLLKAWAARDRFQAGTSMKAWTFVILRNTYLSDMRRSRFQGDYDAAAAEYILSAPAEQQHALHLDDLQQALMKLPRDQREALILIGAGGFSYDEAATICDCAVGTMKSRVARARAALTTILDGDAAAPHRAERVRSAQDAHADIMAEVTRLTPAPL